MLAASRDYRVGFFQTDARPIFHQTAGSLLATILTLVGAAVISALAARSYYLTQQPFYKAVILSIIVFLGIALGCLLFALAINLARRRDMREASPVHFDNRPAISKTDSVLGEIAHAYRNQINQYVRVLEYGIGSSGISETMPYLDLYFRSAE